MSADQREEAVFEAALQLPADQRGAYLDQECAGDAGLRRRVEALLRAFERAGGFMKQTAAPERTVRSSLPPTEKPGDRIGRYKLLQQIGEGGCGVVYMAEQEEPVRRKVALKVIKLGMDTKQVIARFEAERQALALMDHPNIAKVLDAGATDTGRPYFVMELVRGIKITDYCDQNQLSTEDRLKLFTQVCQAIQHAHQKGVIHRDIKPSNILVADHDGVPVPKVIDFGIAKATTDQRLTDKTLFTALEQFIGTPAYMSPEQARLSGLDIDTRTDIYSLGVLLYELLTGKTPFDANDLLAAGLDEMRRTIREVEPVKPSTRLTQELMGSARVSRAESGVAPDSRPTNLESRGENQSNEVFGATPKTARGTRALPEKTKELIHALRGDLDCIVMKALEKDRTRRYETANGLALDVQRHLNNEPVIARPPSKLYEFQKTVRRHKFGFAAAGVVALALVVGMIGTTWQAVRAKAAEKNATETLVQVAAERDAKEQALKDAEAISTFLNEVFRSPDPARDGRTITVAETLDKAVKKLETSLTNQPDRRAKLLETLAGTYFSLGLYQEAIPLQEKVLDYYLAKSGPEDTNTIAAKAALAHSYYSTDRPVEAMKMQEEVLTLNRKVLGPEHPSTLAAMNNLANSYDASGPGRWDEALKLREQLLTLYRKVFGPEDPNTLMAMGNLANSYDHAGRQDEALKLREKVLTLERKVHGPEHPATLMAMGNLADSYRTAGRRDEALKLEAEQLTLRRKVLGPEHPDTLGTMIFLAGDYYDAGRPADAEPLYRETLEAVKRATPTHELVFELGTLAGKLRQQGWLAEAEPIYRTGLILCRQFAQNDYYERQWLASGLGVVLRAQGKWAEAEPFYREAVTNATALWTNDFSKWEWQFNDLVDVLQRQGKTNEIERLKDTCLTARLPVMTR